MSHLATWDVLSSQVVNWNWNYTNSVPVAAIQDTEWNLREAWAVMHLVHKIYKHEVAHSESVTEGSPIIQRSYELIHQPEKKIIVGDLNANSGQEVIFQQPIGRWSSQ
jgi:selenocysteine lyase/cysteine desulfurase